MLSSVLSSQYNPYSNNYSNSYSPNSYRNYNPYSAGFGRPGLGIYGGTSSGYGGVYLSGVSLGSLNLMTPVLKKLDKKLLASQKNFKPKAVPPAKAADVVPDPEAPPVPPERKNRKNLNKEKSRSLTALDFVGSLNSRSLSLNSLASDGYCVCFRFLLKHNHFLLLKFGRDIKKKSKIICYLLIYFFLITRLCSARHNNKHFALYL